MKRIVAVLVSIIWLAFIVGLPALFFVPGLQNFLPAQVQELTNPVVLLERLGAPTELLPADLIALLPDANLPVAETTPAPAPEADTPVPPTDTPIPPADTPTPLPATDTPTPQPPEPTAATAPDGAPVSIPVAVIGQADLRAGPDANADVVGLVAAGATVNVNGKDATGLWYRLDDGTWISVDALAVAPPVAVIDPSAQPSAPDQPPAPDEPTATPTPPSDFTGVTATVNADANLRSGPGLEFDRLDGVNFGTQVTVVGKSANSEWYRLDSGAWLFAALIDEVLDVPVLDESGAPISTPAEPVPGQTVANTPANLRAGPGIEFDVIGSAAVGEVLDVVAQDSTGEWLKLASGSWIFAVLVDNVPADLPVETVDEAPAGADAGGADAGGAPADSEEATASEPADETAAEPAPAESEPATPPTANVDANLRAGPSTDFDIVGSVQANTELTIVAQSVDGEWFKLDNDAWIAAILVDNPPANAPVAEA